MARIGRCLCWLPQALNPLSAIPTPQLLALQFFRKQSTYCYSCNASCTSQFTCFLAGSGASSRSTSLRVWTQCSRLLRVILILVLHAAVASTALEQDYVSVVATPLSVMPITTAHSSSGIHVGLDPATSPSRSTEDIHILKGLDPSLSTEDAHIPKGLDPSRFTTATHILKGLGPSNSVDGDWFPTRIEFIVITLPAIGIISFLVHMIPGGPANQSFRVPPSWGPEQEERY